MSVVNKMMAGSFLAVAVQVGWYIGMTTDDTKTRRHATNNGYTVTETGGRSNLCPVGSFFRTKFKGVAHKTSEKVEGAVCKPLFGGNISVVIKKPERRNP